MGSKGDKAVPNNLLGNKKGGFDKSVLFHFVWVKEFLRKH